MFVHTGGGFSLYYDFTIVLCTSKKPQNFVYKSAGISLRPYNFIGLNTFTAAQNTIHWAVNQSVLKRLDQRRGIYFALLIWRKGKV